MPLGMGRGRNTCCLQPVYLVPTAMNADTFLEERSLAAQLAGAPKKSESLAGLARCGLLVRRLDWSKVADCRLRIQSQRPDGLHLPCSRPQHMLGNCDQGSSSALAALLSGVWRGRLLRASYGGIWAAYQSAAVATGVWLAGKQATLFSPNLKPIALTAALSLASWTLRRTIVQT